MHLKTLALRGFKSFADKAILKFEPGVTIIVGPNGSGKSNITDAVLWVLGEQSPRSLRGSSMEDVIFAGSSERSPLGVAEVSLCLDNSDGSLPIEFSEVTIARRMFRSGENEYFINSSPCRLLDIQDLLSDSGLGRERYSIIGQGRLEEILASKPEERRLLIEEAAGVLKHKKRKERALRKLISMEQCLIRVRDVLGEVNRQLRPLKKQTDRTKIFNDCKSQLRELEIDLAVRELRELQAQWNSLEDKEAELESRIGELKRKLMRKEQEVEGFQVQLEERGLYAGDLGEQRRRLQGIQERFNSGLLLLEEKGKNLIERLSEIRQKTHQLEAGKRRKEEELAELKNEGDVADAQLKALYSELTDARRRAEVAGKKRKAADEGLEVLEGKAQALQESLAFNQGNLSTLKSAVVSAENQIAFLEEQEKALTTKLKEVERSLRENEQRLAGLLKELKKEETSLEQTRKKLDDRSKAIESAQRRERKIGGQVAECSARIRVLESSKKSLAGFPRGVAWLLNSENRPPGVVGAVAELIEVPEKYEKAIEAALGPSMFCVITRTLKNAERALAAAKKEEVGWVFFFPIEGSKEIVAPTPPNISSLIKASSAIKCDRRIKDVIEYLLNGVYIVEDSGISNGLLIKESANCTLVTLSGEVFTGKKLGIGCEGEESFSELASRRELEMLKKQEKMLQSSLQKLTKERKDLEGELAELLKSEKEIFDELQRRRAEERDLNAENARLKIDFADTETKRRLIEEKIANLNGKVIEDKKAMGDTQREITEAIEELNRLKEEIGKAVKKREIDFKEAALVGKEVAECQIKLASLNEREIHKKKQTMVVRGELAEIKRLLNSEHEIAVALECLRARIQPVHALFAQLLERVEWWAIKLQNLAAGEETFFKGVRDSLKKAQDEIRSLTRQWEGEQEELHAIGLDKAQLELKVTGAVEKIVEEYDVPLERALQNYPGDLSREGCEAKAKRLRSKIVSLGPINPIAVDEYSELEKRQCFLEGQLDDLQESKKVLKKVIVAIDKKIKDRFLLVFEEVNQHFQSVFSYLFPGGQANLILSDSDNPLESGIEIEAQPSGKKLQRLSLLSGGETALVALAFLFAIYHTRPSPFYILDEVEAALDDVNLQRFIDLLHKLRDGTQFLIISHQRRTIEMADVLYGVSMQVDGVSKLFSQKLTEYQRAV
ncbi:MAG: chromosome segregation protein SMC [Actinomycetota bacterium]|nr:chromosome segregation protein SMC [Actinomycetota bacterium]